MVVAVDADTLERRRGPGAQRLIIGSGEGQLSGEEPGKEFSKRHQFTGLGKRQRAQKHGMDGAEDGGVGSDRQCQGGNDDQGEAHVIAESAPSIPDILREARHDSSRSTHQTGFNSMI